MERSIPTQCSPRFRNGAGIKRRWGKCSPERTDAHAKTRQLRQKIRRRSTLRPPPKGSCIRQRGGTAEEKGEAEAIGRGAPFGSSDGRPPSRPCLESQGLSPNRPLVDGRRSGFDATPPTEFSTVDSEGGSHRDSGGDVRQDQPIKSRSPDVPEFLRPAL